MLRILIADDHPAIRQVLKEVLVDEFSPVYIEEAEDTLLLLKKAVAGPWDIIISDLYMPGGGGFHFLQQTAYLKEKRPPVIILSMFPAVQYAQKILDAGAVDFIQKDSLPGTLITTVQRLLQTIRPALKG